MQQDAPDWHNAPSRSRGVIEAQLARLTPEQMDLLAVASVEGATFSAQTLAQVLDRGLPEVTAQLSDEMSRTHRLVVEAGVITPAGCRLDRFRFRHDLFHQQVYDSLGESMRRLRHRQVGLVLEKMYGNQAAEIAPRLALHFDLGGEPERALTYYLLVGDKARQLYAVEQTEAAYSRALALAKSLDDDEQMARIYMRLGLSHHNALHYEQAQTAYAEGFRLWSRTNRSSDNHLSPADRPLRIIWGLGPRHEEPTFDLIPDLFSGLVEETPDLAIVPDVAHRWEIEDKGRRYVFHLRDDVRWSDGELVTAYDFAFAWQYNQVPAAASGAPLYEVKGGRALDYGIAADLKQAHVEIPDPYTLVITLPQPAAYFLHLLAHPLAAPQPRHLIERWGDDWATAEHIVSNGPYMLHHWDSESGKMHFVRNPAYHGRLSGNVATVEAFYWRELSGWQQLFRDTSRMRSISCRS